MIEPARFEHHRVELTALCRRMLGAGEAEDAVQETFIRAWRGGESFEGRASLRSWLRRIATNVCLDLLAARKRLARPVESVDALAAESAEQAVLAREDVRLAFVAAVQHLPPKQRAVLILREVLRWRADEVAELFGTSVPSVNSALQRARATLRSATTLAPASLDGASAKLLARYVNAFERDDMDELTSVLHEDGYSARGTSSPESAAASSAGVSLGRGERRERGRSRTSSPCRR